MSTKLIYHFFSTVAISFCFQHSYSQQHATLGDTLFSKNHFEMDLSINGSGGSLTNRSGLSNFSSTIGYSPNVNFSYVVNSASELGVVLGGGFGMHPTGYEVDGQAFPLVGTEGNGYFMNIDSYNPYLSISGGIRYRKLRNRKIMSLEGGLRFNSYSNATTYASEGISIDEDSMNISLWNFNYAFESGFKPFIYGKVGLGKITQNYNIVSFRLIGQYGWNDIVNGNWQTFPGTIYEGEGQYSSSGSSIGLEVGYTFTGIKKQLTKKALFDQGSRQVSSDLRLSRRRNKRILKNYVYIYGGPKFDYNNSNDPHNVIKNVWMDSFKYGMVHGRSIGKDQFIEVGLNQHEYWEAIGIDQFSFGSNAFSALQLDLGWSYNLYLNKNDVNLFKIDAGASIAFNLHGGGEDTTATGAGLVTSIFGDTLLSYTSTSHDINKVFPLVYIGVSKDVRISDKLYLNFTYRYHQGFIKAYEERLTYTSDLVDEAVVKTEVFSRGSYQEFRCGLKYCWGI